MNQLHIIWALLVFPYFAISANSDHFSEINLTPFIESLETKNPNTNFELIENSKDFQNKNLEYFNFGFVKNDIWLKVSSKHIPNSNVNKQFLWIKAHNIDSIDFYYYQDGNLISEFSGHKTPNSLKKLPHRNYIFELPNFDPNSELYFKIHSEISLQFSISLTNELNLRSSDYFWQWIYGLFFGSLAMIIIYNFAISLFVRDINYIYYIGYVIFFGLGQLSLLGFWSYFFVSDSYHWKRIGISLFFSICLVFFINFANSFLKLKKRMPWFYRYSIVLTGLCIGNILLSLFGGIRYASIGVTWLSIIICISLVGVLIWGVKHKIRSFYYFTLAFILLLLSAIVYSLLKFGILPSNVFLEEMLFPVVSLADITVFSFALAERIHILRQEKDNAMAQVANLYRERKISRDILMQSLPKSVPRIDGLYVQIFILPMKDVGGDFYEFHSPNARELGMVLCDVSGHGIPASLISAMGKVAFTTQKENVFSPKRVLEGMNRVLFGNCNPQYLTASYLYLNASSKVWRFGRAGHPSAYLQRQTGEIIKVHPKGKIMGAFPEIQIEELTYPVEPKDRVLLLSDGVLESFDPNGLMYGEQRILEFLRVNQHLPTYLFKQALIQDLESFSKRDIKEWDDDITFIFLELL
ncbi:7TM diverse intracellular signaling domain-containing protein [Leptospira sp. 96542]|nr:7TM diverse intracellular signaling domain-containing protein [Leptospira sp. 96542]